MFGGKLCSYVINMNRASLQTRSLAVYTLYKCLLGPKSFRDFPATGFWSRCELIIYPYSYVLTIYLFIFLLCQINSFCATERQFRNCGVYENLRTSERRRHSLNKRYSEQYNSCARALKFLVHFFAVLCKTTTWNGQILRCLENEDNDD